MTRIFIESGKKGSNEYQFIEAVMLHFFKRQKDDDYIILNTGGYTNLGNIKNQFNTREFADVKNLIIFDADYTVQGAGFECRKTYLLQYKKSLTIDFDLFLFPNNKDDGMFETLLSQIVNPDYRDLLFFFNDYEENIKEFNEKLKIKNNNDDDVFEVPDEKALIYSYISAFKRTVKEKEEFKNKYVWSFDNPNYWDLNAPALKPLIDFLSNRI